LKEIVINKNDSGQRLDKFITKYMPALPQSMLYKGLRKNCIKINGKHEKNASRKLEEGDVLNLYFKDEFFQKQNPDEAFYKIVPDIDIIYEDENILLINKKPGMVVHTDDDGESNTLIEHIKSYLFRKGEFVPENEKTFVPSLCNRIDRNTGGIVIAAKNAETLRIMNQKIKDRELKKQYLCITKGYLEKKEDVPTTAITMGMMSIMQAKKVLLVANGPKKKEIVEKSFFGPITPEVPASILQLHPDVTVIYSEE